MHVFVYICMKLLFLCTCTYVCYFYLIFKILEIAFVHCMYVCICVSPRALINTN